MKSSDCFLVVHHLTVTVHLVQEEEAQANLSCPGPKTGWWLSTGVLVRSSFALAVLSFCHVPNQRGLIYPHVALVALPANGRSIRGTWMDKCWGL